MEIHHHSGHDRGSKTWKSYLSEFVMLFVAVFCGSMAEYFLEHKIESDREKEYVQAIIRDLMEDTLAFDKVDTKGQMQFAFYTKAGIALSMFSRQKIGADSLLSTLSTKNDEPATIYVNNSAFSQLKFSGGLRLIKRDSSRNAISEYYSIAERLDDQRKTLNSLMIEMTRTFSKVIDMGISKSPDLINITNPGPNFNKAAYIKQLSEKIVYNRDPKVLHELSNSFFYISNLQRSYLEEAKKQKEAAQKLLSTLKKEYN